MKKKSLYYVLPLAILIEIVGIGATIYGYHALKKGAEEVDAARFEMLALELFYDFEVHMDAHQAILYGTVGMLNGSDDVTPADWRRYVQSIPLQRSAAGIIGMGTIRPVDAGQRQAVVDELSRMHAGAFAYSTVGGSPPPQDESFIVDRMEPEVSHRWASGLDLATDPRSLSVIIEARDTGQPRISAMITSLQEDAAAGTCLLVIPRYRVGASLDTIEQRRQAFVGAVFAPVVCQNIIEMPTTWGSSELAFALYDTSDDAGGLLCATADPARARAAPYSKQLSWPYEGRNWRVQLWATNDFVSKVTVRHQMVFLFIGIGLSSILAMVLFLFQSSHRRALRLMDQFYEQASETSRINELFVKNAPASIAILDQGLRFLAASPRWMQQFRLQGQVIGRHCYDVLPEILKMPEWREANKRGLQGASQSGPDERFVRADGSVHYLRWEVHPWQKAGGEIGGIIIFSLDLTEEVQNRMKLDKTRHEYDIMEERLRQATKAANIGVWDYDMGSDRMVCNHEMFELLGIDMQSFGGNLVDFIGCLSPDDRPRAEEVIRDSMQKGAGFEMECRTVREDQPTVLAIGDVRCDPEGRPTRMLGVCINITAQAEMRHELKLASEQHQMALREAQQHAKARQQFLATMSHEIRTPMNGMIGLSELLLKSPLDAQQQEFASTIVQCGQSLLALVDDILDFSKIEAGGMELASEPFDPAALVERAARMLEGQSSAKGLRILPSCDLGCGSRVLGDEHRIQQVLLNLLSNAVKFTRQGEIRITLHPVPATEGRVLLVFRVEDTGMGMSAEDLSRAFVPFVQADASTTRRFGGTGLGLSISRSLALMMGGTLDLDSVPGVGTTATFKVELPIACEAPEGAQGAAGAGSAPDQCKPFGRVLVVEDNRVNQRVTELQMMRFADHIDLACDGRDAVVKFRHQHYDLVLMDLQMPVMDGFEAVRQIRLIERVRGGTPVPVIALSANIQEDDRRRALGCGMNGFLCKPLLMHTLAAELARHKRMSV